MLYYLFRFGNVLCNNQMQQRSFFLLQRFKVIFESFLVCSEYIMVLFNITRNQLYNSNQFNVHVHVTIYFVWACNSLRFIRSNSVKLRVVLYRIQEIQYSQSYLHLMFFLNARGPSSLLNYCTRFVKNYSWALLRVLPLPINFRTSSLISSAVCSEYSLHGRPQNGREYLLLHLNSDVLDFSRKFG